MPDSIEIAKIPWHPGFYGAAELELAANKADLEFHREYNLSKEPLKMDLLVIKKLSDIRLENEIGWIFKKYNVVEYKSPEDGLSIDDFYKTIGYACLYKGLGTTVNQVPAEELTVSVFRERFPRELFDSLKAAGFEIEEHCQGIYYINGQVPFDTQIVVTGRLDKKTHLSLRILSGRVQEADARAFLEKTGYIKQPGERNNAEAVLQVSILANRKLYEKIRRDLNMCEALRDLMKDEIEAEINKKVAEATKKTEEEVTKKVEAEVTKKVEAEVTKKVEAEVTKKVEAEVTKKVEAEVTKKVTQKATEEKISMILTSIRNLMDSMKWTAEQAMAAMKIPDADRAGYMARLIE